MGLATPAVAADSLVLGTPLEAQLANFGAASYPVFNSITDVSPLVDKLVAFVDKKVKAPDAAELASTAVDGLLAKKIQTRQRRRTPQGWQHLPPRLRVRVFEESGGDWYGGGW